MEAKIIAGGLFVLGVCMGAVALCMLGVSALMALGV